MSQAQYEYAGKGLAYTQTAVREAKDQGELEMAFCSLYEKIYLELTEFFFMHKDAIAQTHGIETYFAYTNTLLENNEANQRD